MSIKSIRTALAIIAIGASTAHADDASQTMFKFKGFGTLGASQSSEQRGDYVLDNTIPAGAGLSNDWATGNDSRLGIQVLADFTPQIKAVLQVVSEYDSDNTYNPHIEWANFKYVLSPRLSFRFGRIGLPTFLNSENRDVGYSYPWIHPPIDLYRQMSFTHSDGLESTYRVNFGDSTNAVKVIYGRSSKGFPTSTSTANDLWGVFETLEYEATVIHVGYQAREISSLNQLTGVTSTWVRNSDLSVGAVYDTGKWFVMSEWIQVQSTTKKQAMYFSTGIRIDKFTPYFTYSQNSPASILPDSPPPTATAIQTAKNAQSTVSLGTRWDFMKNVDLKLQYDMVKLSADSNGDLANVPANVTLYGNKFHVLSVVVDFIF